MYPSANAERNNSFSQTLLDIAIAGEAGDATFEAIIYVSWAINH